MNILSPSILSADFCNLGKQIKEVEQAGAQYLHIDVMDGLFVPSISYGMPVIASIRKSSGIFFDVHLMIEKPERYVREFAESGADLINFHIEATDDVYGTIEKIRGLGKKVGITIKPKTPAKAAEPYLALVDMVLVMTVEPGFGGQKLIPECLDKVSELRRMAAQKGLCPDIEVDGGINADNVGLALQAGANVIVAGSAVFGNDIAGNVRKFLSAFAAFEGKEDAQADDMQGQDGAQQADTLRANAEKLHTTPMGMERIRKNLSLTAQDPIAWCRSCVLDPQAKIERQGKNWYVRFRDCEITVNAYSYTIITAHKIK